MSRWLRQCGFAVIEESRIPTLAGIRKSDIIASNDGSPVVLNAQMKSDTLGWSQEHDRKRVYYDVQEILDWIKEQIHVGKLPTSLHHHAQLA